MSGVTDLVEFLRARLDEDEQVARQDDYPEKFGDYSHLSFIDYGDIRIGTMRVLAEVDAKRRIVDEHSPRTTDYMDAPPEESCRRCGKHDEYPVPHPCRTLRLLALPYADREGYDESWRP